MAGPTEDEPFDGEDKHADSTASSTMRDGVTFARGALVNGATLLVANLRGVFTFLIARVLGSAALGTFGMAWAVMDIVSRIGVFGLDTGVMTMVARRDAVADRDGVRQLFRTAIGWGVGISAATAVIAIAVVLILGRALELSPAVVAATAVLLLALPGMALYRIGTGVSRGLRVMRHDFYSHGIAETVATLLTFSIAIGVGYRVLVPEVAGTIGVCASGVVALLLARRAVRSDDESDCSRPPVTRELLTFSAPISGYMLLNVLMSRLDVLLLGLFVDRAPGLTLESFGVYCAAVEVAGGLRKVRLMFDPIFAPVVAGHSARGDIVGMRAGAAQVGRWVLAVQLPMLGVVVVASSLVMSIFGPTFRAGATWVVVIAMAQMVTGFTGLAETVLMVERPRLNLINSAVTTAFYAATATWLIQSWGPLGAATAALLSACLLGLIRYLELRLVSGWSWPWTTHFRPLAAFSAALLPALGTRVLLATPLGWGAEIIAGLVLLAIYAAVWQVLGLEDADRETWTALRGRRS